MSSNHSHIDLEQVSCPDCGEDHFKIEAKGPDYDHDCCGDQIFTLVRCRKCETCYLNPRPTANMLDIIYEADQYICYDFDVKGNSFVQLWRERSETARIQSALKYSESAPANMRVLDIGPGDGTTLAAFGNIGVARSNLWGLDIKPEIIDKLESRGMQGILSRAEEMKLDAERFDLVSMLQVIEHVGAPRRVLENIYRGLRPGGLLWLETPNIEGWDRRFFAARAWGGYHFPRHWILWSPKTLSRLLKETGFEVIGVWGMSATFVWMWSFEHVLKDLGTPTAVSGFFTVNNPLLSAVFLILDSIPRWMGHSSNMRVIARRPHTEIEDPPE